jgi:DNA replication protein DnaC
MSPKAARRSTSVRQDACCATAMGVQAIMHQQLRGRFFSTIELVNAQEAEQAAGRAGQLAHRLTYADLVILDELGHLPFSQTGGARSCST